MPGTLSNGCFPTFFSNNQRDRTGDRPSIVEKVGGWGESLLAAQDEDFFISLALAGARVVYQPGSHSIYRRHGSGRIITSNRLRWLDNHCRVLDMAKETLSVSGNSYFALARNYYDIDRRKYGDLMEKVFALQPLFRPRESSLYNVTQRALGLGPAESRCGGRCR
jgi:GT2 family glycosyltransferase